MRKGDLGGGSGREEGASKGARVEAPAGRRVLGRELEWRLQQGRGLREGLSKTLVGEIRLERAGNIWKEKLEAAH